MPFVAIPQPTTSYTRLNNAPRCTNVYPGADNPAPINRQAVRIRLNFRTSIASDQPLKCKG